MPAIKLVPEDKLIGGLNEIVNALEKKYVEPSIGKVGDPSSPSATNKAELDDLWESFQKSQTGGDPKNMTPKIEKVDKIIQVWMGCPQLLQQPCIRGPEKCCSCVRGLPCAASLVSSVPLTCLAGLD